jgi:hypothetical protein
MNKTEDFQRNRSQAGTMIEIRYTGDALWERIERALEKVKDRLNRVTSALENAGIPYAVIGGNAVQLWVAQVDESVVRNTRDVDIIINPEDLPKAIIALEKVGFIYRHVKSIDMFLDGPDAKARDAVHVLFAGVKVKQTDSEPVPQIDKVAIIKNLRTIPLEGLVKLKLISFRDKDRTHLRDMLSINLIDETWLDKLPTELAERLKILLDDPEG